MTTTYRRGDPPQASIVSARLSAEQRGSFSAYRVAADVAELQALDRRMTAIAVRQCNGYHDEKQEQRDQRAWDRYKGAAADIARQYGATVTAQGDPRGAVLRLVMGDGHEVML